MKFFIDTPNTSYYHNSISKTDPVMTAKNKPKVVAKKVLVSIIIGFVAVAFVGSFAYRYISRGGSDANLAIINGEPINVGSDSLFANTYRQYFEEEKQKSGEGISDEKNRELTRRALDTVIQRTLILQYAEREGIRVSVTRRGQGERSKWLFVPAPPFEYNQADKWLPHS